jgi:hypothetical protein
LRRCFAFIGSFDAHAAQDFRREVRDAGELDQLPLSDNVAHAQLAVVGDADHVAGEGVLGNLAILRHEHHRRVNESCLPLCTFRRMPRWNARAHAEEGDAVAVVGVHVRLDLEHEAGDFRSRGPR